MATVFHRDAPLTVRTGAVFVVLLAMIDLCFQLLAVWAAPDGEAGLYEGLFRPALRFSVGIVFAWGIARMLGLFYWSWVVLAALVLVFLVIAPFLYFYRTMEIGAVSIGPIGLLSGAVWLTGIGFLLSPSSLRAYWKNGRLY